jgi:hypothetical protein
MSTRIGVFLLALGALAAPASAQIEEVMHLLQAPDAPDLEDLEASSLQIYRVPLSYTVRKLEDRPWGLKITFPVSFGAYDLRAATSVGEIVERLDTVSLVPGVEFAVPVAPEWVLKPFGEVGAGTAISGGRGTELLYSAGLKCRGELSGRTILWTLGGAITGYGSSSDAVTDLFGSFELAADGQVPLGFSIGTRQARGGVYGIVRRFAGMELVTGAGPGIPIREQYEAGISFSTDPVIRLWKIRFPWMAIGYRFGDGIDGIRISLSFPF